MQSFSQWLNRTKACPKPRKRVRRVSPKHQRELAIYNRMLPGWKKRHPVCEVCPRFHEAGIMVKCKIITTHPHHIRGRIGKLLYDESNMLASCSGEGHPEAVHFTHRDAARKLGLLIP